MKSLNAKDIPEKVVTEFLRVARAYLLGEKG